MILLFLSLLPLLISASNHDNTTEIKHYLPLISRPLQSTLLTIILATAIIFNSAIIINISKDGLKMRMVHFVLIRHVCIADLVGACVVIPVPLVAVVRGHWSVPDPACTLISITTATVWTMHLVAVAFYRADRVLAVWLARGRYPLVTVWQLNLVLTTTWALVITLATLATLFFGQTYQPTLALCIPNVPLIFFIIVFSGYISGILLLSCWFLYSFLRRRKKQQQKLIIRSVSMETIAIKEVSHHRHSNETITQQKTDKIFLKKPIHHHHRTGAMATRAIYSYSISLGHLLLYLPSIMIVGLVKATALHPVIAFFCGIVVYCEFLIQPAALLFLSPRLRREVFWQ